MSFDRSAKAGARVRRNWGKSTTTDTPTSSLLLNAPLALDGSGTLSLQLSATGGLHLTSSTLGVKLNGATLSLAAGGLSLNLANSNTWTVTQHFADVDATGNLIISAVGKGLKIKEGANATMGVATLVAGSVVVATTKVTASSRIVLTINGIGVLANSSAVYEDTASRSAGVSFTIKSLNVLATDSVCWVILEPA